MGLQGVHLREWRGVMIQTISWSMMHACMTITVLLMPIPRVVLNDSMPGPSEI